MKQRRSKAEGAERVELSRHWCSAIHRIAVAVLVALLVSPGWAGQTAEAAPAEEKSVFSQIESLMEQLSEITGLKAKRPVEYAVIQRDELKSFLEERIREEIKPEEILVEEMLLKKFGFVPQDFALKETMVDLYTEQAAAFYDFRKKKLFLLDSDEGVMQEAALVHELAHALADQHFRLERFLNRAGRNDDGALARMAVMEGQATWLMSEFIVRRMGQSLKTSPEMVEIMSRMIGSSGGQFPVFDNVPLYIRQSLIFPYTSGMEFQHALVERLGDGAFAEPFRHPPSSTREVLHPETYDGRPDRTDVKLPKIEGQSAYEAVAEGTVGEFDYAVLVQQFLDEDAVRRIAPGWRAGSYRLLEHKQSKDTVLMHASEWSSPEAAARFFKAYGDVLRGKWKATDFKKETEVEYSGRGDDGYFVVRTAGATVYCVEGLNDEDQVQWPQR